VSRERPSVRREYPPRWEGGGAVGVGGCWMDPHPPAPRSPSEERGTSWRPPSAEIGVPFRGSGRPPGHFSPTALPRQRSPRAPVRPAPRLVRSVGTRLATPSPNSRRGGGAVIGASGYWHRGVNVPARAGGLRRCRLWLPPAGSIVPFMGSGCPTGYFNPGTLTALTPARNCSPPRSRFGSGACCVTPMAAPSRGGNPRNAHVRCGPHPALRATPLPIRERGFVARVGGA